MTRRDSSVAMFLLNDSGGFFVVVSFRAECNGAKNLNGIVL
ncbi:hypothetical protein V8G61_13950 [Gaetbulibacter sp. M240]